MATRLRTLLESLDDLPEAIDPRDLYVEGSGDDAGKYVLDLDPVDGLELARTGALAKALDRERKGNRSGRSRVGQLEQELAEAREQLEAFESAGNGDGAEALAKERKAFEAKLASAQQAAQAQIEKLTAERDAQRDRFRQSTVEREIVDALTNGEVKANPKVLGAMFAQHARWDTDDEGNDVLTVLDMDGQTPLMKAGQPGSFRDLAQRYANHEDFADVFRVQAASGGDRRGQPATAQNTGRRVYRASLEEAKDFATWEALEKRAEAGEFELQPPTMGEG